MHLLPVHFSPKFVLV